MKKRYLLTVMAAVMLAASLVGCARTSSGSGTSTNTSSETETAEADTATETTGEAETTKTTENGDAQIHAVVGEDPAAAVTVEEDTATDYGSLQLTMGSTGAAEDISTQAMNYMAAYVDKKSGGAVTISTFPASQMGSAVDQLEMTGQGSIDLFLEANFMSSNGVPEAKVGSLTFLCGSKEEYRALNESGLHKEWEEEFRKKNNINVIADNWYRNGTALISNKRAETVAEMAGIKVRVPQVDMVIDSFKAGGMNPTPIAYNESLLSLQQGIVDAIWCTEDAAYTMGFYEVAKYIIELNCYYDSMFVYMNDDLYNNITDAQRDLIIEAANAAGDYYTALADEALTKNVKAMTDAGLELISLSDEEVRKLQAPMADLAKKYEEKGEWPKGEYDKTQEIFKSVQ